MYVSEDSFPHLREAAVERQLRDLENRRIAYERRAAVRKSASGHHGVRERIQTFRRFAHLAPKPIPHP